MASRYEYEKFLPQGEFCMHDVLLEDNPGIRLFIEDSLVMKDKSKFDKYKNDNLLEIEINGEKSQISEDLLFDLIDNEGMFKYLLHTFNRDYLVAANIQLLENGQPKGSISITKAQLVFALSKMKVEHPNKINAHHLVRIILMQSLTNSNACRNNYYDLTYPCIIDNEVFEFSSTELLRVLTCSNKDFKEFLQDKNAIPNKKIVAYALVDFCEKEELFKKYIFDEYVYRRYNDIKSFKTIDFESINKNKKSDDDLSDGKSLLDSFDINMEIIDAVYEDIDKYYSPVEKAIYIYIRLCDLLSYDDEIVSSKNMYEKSGRHASIQNIGNITLSNNKVVSYEFMLIYAKFLKDLGIIYSLNLNSMAGYTSEKSSIRFKHDEYLISVDLFESIIKNDMSMVKIGGTLKSIKSYNKNEVTHRKFEELLYGIYSSYNNTKERRKEFFDNVRKYKIKYNKDSASKKDKLYVLFKLLGRDDLKGIDSINYIKEVATRVIGDDEDISYDLFASIESSSAKPIIVIKFNTEDDVIYYLIDVSSEDKIRMYNAFEINRMINDKKIVYITGDLEKKQKEGIKHVK